MMGVTSLGPMKSKHSAVEEDLEPYQQVGQLGGLK